MRESLAVPYAHPAHDRARGVSLHLLLCAAGGWLSSLPDVLAVMRGPVGPSKR
jgi:hypothetical protein